MVSVPRKEAGRPNSFAAFWKLRRSETRLPMQVNRTTTLRSAAPLSSLASLGGYGRIDLRFPHILSSCHFLHLQSLTVSIVRTTRPLVKLNTPHAGRPICFDIHYGREYTRASSYRIDAM